MTPGERLIRCLNIGTGSFRLLLFGFLLVTSSGLYLLIDVGAQADEGNIKVVEVGAENRYPQGIRFFVTASSPDQIDEIRLFFKKTGRVTASAYRALEFDPGALVNADSLLSTSGGQNYMPPGTEITYSFEIRDQAGSVHRTPELKVVYSDARFDWETLVSGPIIIYYYGKGAEERARMALEAAREAMERMSPVLGLDPTEPIRIVSYFSYGDMIGALPLINQILPGHVQTEGMAFGDERVVLIRGFDPDVRGIASHEITHLAIAAVTGRANTRIPSWLSEGLAEYGNIDPSPAYDQALRISILRNRLRPLWELVIFAGSGDDIITAYGQSRSVVQFLVSTYGEEKIAELMGAIRNAFDIDQALQSVYGFDQYGLDSEWRLSLGLEPLPQPEERRPRRQSTPIVPNTPTAAPTPPPTTPPPTPTPPPTVTPVPSTFTPRPTATSPPTATLVPATATPEPTTVTALTRGSGEPRNSGGEARDRSSPGCSNPQPGVSGPLGGDLSLLAILVAPLAMLLFRGRRPF